MIKDIEHYSNDELLKVLAERGVSAETASAKINSETESIKRAKEQEKLKKEKEKMKQVKIITCRNTLKKALSDYLITLLDESPKAIEKVINDVINFEDIEREIADAKLFNYKLSIDADSIINDFIKHW